MATSTNWDRLALVMNVRIAKGYYTICTAVHGVCSSLSASRASEEILFFMRRSQSRHLFFLYSTSSKSLLLCSGQPHDSFVSHWILLVLNEIASASRSTQDRASVISAISLHIIVYDIYPAPSCCTTLCLRSRKRFRSSSLARYGTYVMNVSESPRRRTI